MIKLIFLLVLFIPLVSCSSEVEKHLEGTWTFQYILDSKGDLEPYLYSDVIGFRLDKNCVLPEHRGSELVSKDNKGIWNIKEITPKEYELTIESTNVAFKGTYKVKFYYDKIKEDLYVTLEKPDLNILAIKWSYSSPTTAKFISDHTDPTTDLGEIYKDLPIKY